MKKNQHLQTAIKAVKAAESIIKQHYQQEIEIKIKADQSPVTPADTQAELEIKKVLQKKFPNHGFVGEEEGGNRSSRYNWIIDPIDGTKNFNRGLPFFCTQLGLMKDDEFILGVANYPILDSLMYAERESGAFLNQQPIRVSKTNQLKDSYFCHGGIKYFQRQGLLDQVNKLSETTRFSRGWGAEFGQYYLPTGHLDIHVDPYIEVWDIAAFIVILEEAGGKITDFEGRKATPQTTKIIATNGLLHEQILSYFKL